MYVHILAEKYPQVKAQFFPLTSLKKGLKYPPSVRDYIRLTSEFSGTKPEKRGTQSFGANPLHGRATCLLPEPVS